MTPRRAVDAAVEILTSHVRQATGPDRALMTYGQLSDQLQAKDLDYPPRSQVMSVLLADVSAREYAEGRGMLSAIVVQSSSTEPGAGFYRLAKGKPYLRRGKDQQLDIWWPEVQRVFAEQRELAGEKVTAPSKTMVLEDLGAWMVTCNPQSYRIANAMADGQRHFDNWSVRPSSRTRMFEYGQRIFLWMTGPSHKPELEPGIWGVGFVTGAAQPGSVDPDDPLWPDKALRERSTLFVPIDLKLLKPPLPRSVLAAEPRLQDLEILKMPAMSNPLWVSKDQLTVIAEYLELPPLDGMVSANGAGFASDPAIRKAVELAAVKVVTDAYSGRGWHVADVSKQCLGWDLTCTSPAGTVECVEVKGVKGIAPAVLLTKNEHSAAERRQGWRLAVVTEALSDEPQLRIVDGPTATGASKPFMYQVDLTDTRARIDLFG